MRIRSKPALLLIVSTLATAQAGVAATVSMTFNDPLSGATTGSAALTIQDIGANEVQVTLTPNFAGTSLQTVTGLWLNDPGLTSLTVTPVSPTPNAFITSTYATTQTLFPGGAAAATTGQYDSYLQFNNGTGAVIRGTTPETFDLTAVGGSGFSALSFNLADAPKGAGGQSNLYGVIGLTNYLGTAGSGVGYIAATATAVSAVPVPAALPLLLSGLTGLGAMLRRRRRA